MKARKIAPPPPSPPLSATAIARKIGRSPQGVIDAIGRMGLTPELSLASGNYYSESEIPKIQEGMRRKNEKPED